MKHTQPACRKLIRARMLLTQASLPIEDGAVIVQGGSILAVGEYHDLLSNFSVDKEIDLGEQILLPGLINAHCHLDYTSMRGKLSSEKNFTEWLKKIKSLKELESPENYLAAIQEGEMELRRWGTTSVFNIGAIPQVMEILPTLSLRTWWFYELMDISIQVSVEACVLELLKFSRKPDWLGGWGLSPHAPYTVSKNLYKEVKFYAETHGIPVTTHLAETVEEVQMFREGCGPLFEFLQGVGRPMSDCKKKSPVAILLEEKLLPRRSILAHVNCLEEGDWELIGKVVEQVSVVHCPKTHAYFKREKFHFERLRQSGVSVCLGTDSLASNDSLNLFEEMRLFLRSQGGGEQEVLDMVTLHPANAIGLAGQLGIIAVGARADFIAIPFDGRRKEATSAVVHHAEPIAWMMVDGLLKNQSYSD